VRSGRRIGLAAEVTSADAMFENARWPFTESLECWMDGRPSIRIHSFDAASAPEVSRRFGQRHGAGIDLASHLTRTKSRPARTV
jgi:hypothetical protein